MSELASGTARPSVLLVEDDDAIRLLIVRLLRRASYDVTEVPDGTAAIRQLQAVPYDAVILDLMMPRANGFEVLAYMREHLTPRKCVVIISAAAERTIKMVDPSLVVAVLRKPFDLQELLMAVEACVPQFPDHLRHPC